MIYEYIYLILTVVVAYIIGSIPTGYLVVKKFKGIDIRETGSGSTGATNVKRIMGTKWFFIVLLADALKGVIAVLSARHFTDFLDFKGLSPVLAATAVIIGHSKSVFLKFSGGKSVATGVGTLLALCWQVGLVIALVWGSITWVSKYVSLGSVIAVSFAPLLMYVFNQNEYSIWFAAICAVFVVIRHKDNLKRLFDGTESRVRK